MFHLQMKTSGAFLPGDQLFCRNEGIWNMHGREECLLNVCRSKSKETLCRLLITMAEETFDMGINRSSTTKR